MAISLLISHNRLVRYTAMRRVIWFYPYCTVHKYPLRHFQQESNQPSLPIAISHFSLINFPTKMTQQTTLNSGCSGSLVYRVGGIVWGGEMWLWNAVVAKQHFYYLQRAALTTNILSTKWYRLKMVKINTHKATIYVSEHLNGRKLVRKLKLKSNIKRLHTNTKQAISHTTSRD